MQNVVLCVLAAGGLLQGAYLVWRARLPFWLACAGAVCVALASLAERDITLLCGQLVVLYLLHVIKTRQDTHE